MYHLTDGYNDPCFARFFLLLFLSFRRFFVLPCRFRLDVSESSLLSELCSRLALAAAMREEVVECRLAEAPASDAVPNDARAACCSRSVRAALRSSSSCCGMAGPVQSDGRTISCGAVLCRGKRRGVASLKRRLGERNAYLERLEFGHRFFSLGSVQGSNGAEIFGSLYHLRKRQGRGGGTGRVTTLQLTPPKQRRDCKCSMEPDLPCFFLVCACLGEGG
jgi:hypothetical protein